MQEAKILSLLLQLIEISELAQKHNKVRADTGR